MEAQEKMTAKVFMNKILQGTALGVMIRWRRLSRQQVLFHHKKAVTTHVLLL